MATAVVDFGVPWVTPKEVYAAATILPVIGIYAIMIRARRRLVLEVPFDWDDWLLLPAAILVFGCALTLIIGVTGRAFGHPAPSSTDQTYCIDTLLQFTIKLELAFLLEMTLAFGLLKMSVTFFYRRIFATRRGSVFDWASWLTIGISGIWMIVFLVLFIILTGRETNALVRTSDDGTCNPQYYFFSNYFVLSDLFTNVLVWLLPFPMVLRLEIRPLQKLQIFAALLLGSLSVIGGAVKTMITLQVAALDPTAIVDWELTISTTLYWCMIEGGLGVIASCLPDLYYYAMKLAEPTPEQDGRSKVKVIRPWQPERAMAQVREVNSDNTLRQLNPNSPSSPQTLKDLPRGAARAQLKYEMVSRPSRDLWAIRPPSVEDEEAGTSYHDALTDTIGIPSLVYGNPRSGTPTSRYTPHWQADADDIIAPAPRTKSGMPLKPILRTR